MSTSWSTSASAASGPPAMEMATARLSSTIGDGCRARQLAVQTDQLLPVRLLGAEGPGVAGGDGRLEGVGAARVAERVGPGQRVQAPVDVEAVPGAAVLVQQEDGRARRPGPGAQARRLDLHQRHQPVDLGLVRREGGQDAAEPQRLGAELGAEPVLAGGGRVALVEDEVDHLEHGAEPGGPVVAGRAPRRGRRRWRSSSWRARCAARWWVRARRRPGRSRGR